MPKVRLNRQKIEVPTVATVHAPAAQRSRIIVDGKPFPIDEIESLENLGPVLDVVQRRASSFRKPIAYLHQIRPFLQCCAMHGRIDRNALVKYKKIIGRQNQNDHNTKAETFGYALNLTKYLFDIEVLGHFDLPKNFKRKEQKPKANLFDLAPMVWEQAPDAIRDLATDAFRLDEVGQEAALTAAVLSARLEAVRRAAKAEIAQIHDAYVSTQALIHEAKRTGRFDELINLRNFPHSLSVDDAIVWAFARYGSTLPQSDQCDQAFYWFAKNRLGGFSSLQKRFAPDLDALTPFIALQLSEHVLACNVDGVIRYTYRGCLGEGESNATQVVTFGKWRGTAQEISRELLRGCKGEWTLPRALDFLHVYTGELLDAQLSIDPRINDSEGRQCLYIHFDKVRNKWVTWLNESSSNKALRRFLSRAAKTEPMLSPLVTPIRGDSFRPSIALLDRMEGRSIFQTQRLLAHDNPETTAQYTDRQSVASQAPLHALGFQRFLTEKIISARTEVPPEAKPVGNGLYCTDPASGGPRGETVDGVCASHDLCDHKCVASVIVVEDPPSVAQWIAWSKHIESGRSALEASNPDRWKVWERRAALYQVLLEKTSARCKRIAEAFVDEIASTLPSLT